MNEDVESLIQNSVDENKVFALWRKPGSSIKGVAANSYQNVLSASIPSKTGFLIAPFRENNNYPRLFIPAEVTLPDQNHLLHQVRSHPFEKATTPDTTSKQEYEGSFRTIKQAINENATKKAVLSKTLFSEAISRSKASAYFFALEKAYPHAMVYLLNLPGKGCWAGATPEILLTKKAGGYETVALAGTKPAQADLKWREKEIHEQALVSEFIQNTLQEMNIHHYRQEGPNDIKAGNVMHLKTSFFIPKENINGRAMELAEKLHPTPAVCGLPREESLKLISETETHDRAYYTGFLGEFDHKENSMNFFVNLRCMQIFDEGALLYVGGGITADSDLEEEWQETEEKSKTLLNIAKK